MDIDLNSSDNLLVSRIRNDSREAFKLLYNRYNKKIHYFSLRYLGNVEEAEELVQSVFISIWEHRKSLDERMSVKSYIYRSSVNYIYNYLKKKAIRARFIEVELQKDEVLSNQTLDQVLLHDLEKSINLIIEKLPPQQKKIFRLSRFDGLSHEKIAQQLNLSVRTVENQIHRALSIIKNKLKDSLYFLF
jgi:RNA polymerase sigma-70 factor (family 1)